MSAIALRAAVLVVLLSQVGAAAQRDRPLATRATTVTLSVVGTNDLHGGVLPRDGRGGLAALGAYVANLRAARERDGGGVLLVDAGDMFQGTLESNLGEGAAVIAAYNTLGYTAAAIGNHEFDFGPAGPAATPRTPGDDPRGALKARAAEATFPVLAANIIDVATGRPVDWPNVTPSALIKVSGVDVGIVGVTTAATLTATTAANTRGLRIAPLAETIRAEAQVLRNRGAVVVIVAAHAGGRCTRFDAMSDLSSCDPQSEIFAAARALPRGLVDVIVAGHTHAGVAHDVQGILIIESFSGGRSFGRVDLQVDRAARRVISGAIFPPQDLCVEVDPRTARCDGPVRGGSRRVTATYEGNAVVPDAGAARALAPAVRAAAVLKSKPLGVFIETELSRTGAPESPLGNFFTDALRSAVPEAAAAIYNVAGGLRADLPAGPLTYGRLFEVFPFDDRIVLLRLTGAELKRVFTAQLRQSRNVVGLSGLRVSAACSSGALVVTVRGEDGRVIADDDRITVATMDFLATGGDRVFAPIAPPGGFRLADDPRVARDEIVKWLAKRGGRVRADGLVDETRPRWSYPGALPVRCGTAG